MNLRPAWLLWNETQTLIGAFTGSPLRFVGGAVRDAILEREVKDVDAATTLTPDAVMQLLARAGINAIPTGMAHGTVTAVIGGKHFEITTLRKDVETFGRHATVEYTDSWEEDAKRRDFTMNALYLSPEGELTDYFGGENDAKEGRVKFIGSAKERIAEDYLRILRYFRFWAHYGKTAPDNEALTACAAAADKIAALSAERIQHEMLKLLAAPKSYHAIGFMIERGIFAHVFGFELQAATALRRLEEMTAAFSESVSAPAKIVALCASPEHAQIVISRWKLSNALAAQIQNFCELSRAIVTTLSFPEQKKLIRKYGNAVFREAVMLAWAKGNEMIEKSHPYHAMLMLAREWQAPAFMIGGKDLQALGIAEGKQMGEVLKQLESAWEMSDYKATKEELLAKIK